ncbi:MAG: FAD-binding oxidoreductase [Rudaea sp.]|uniref:FAD-binding oxidoreductase n=1 Tax=Rudaea sp. 3F27F6 TaxID=2502208 RepID=UPI001485B18B|nr:FAD-binding oxidoreductase [Rudaea sp. 3F27F6]MBR0347720.1 FAD-binding oxidoreductase [Rudaea sp.]
MSSQTATINADDFRTFPRRLEGKARSRHHAEYAGWHASACWNGRHFDRFPEYIVRAQSLTDVASTIDFARSHRLSISVRGNGHSYAGCFMRDSGILLDLSALKQIEIDVAGRSASVQPGVTSRLLSAALAPHGLAFPTGHGGDVGISGFLLGGGLGINFHAWGNMSTFSVYAVDVMLADGRLVHADAEENPDLFWAARGAGPLSFFVVVKFHLRCYSLPVFITSNTYSTSLDRLPELLSETERIGPEASLQVMVAVVSGSNGHGVVLNTLAFAEDSGKAEQLHASLIYRLPQGLVDVVSENAAASFESLYNSTEAMLVSRRYRTDNVLTDRGADSAKILASHLPRQPSAATVSLFIWRGDPVLPEAAFSAHGRFFLSTYAQWNEEQDDELNRRWLNALYDDLAGVSTASYINEFDLEKRSESVSRCFAPSNWSKLMELRHRFDPDGVFHDTRMHR